MSEGTNHKVIFSVVVPTFNRPEQLVACLEALAVQTLPRSDFEVIIVNDGGDPSLERVLDKFTGRLQLKMLWQPNGGCGPARQLGIAHAEGEYLAFTDDDCRPAPDWLNQLMIALERAPGCAVAGRTINGVVEDFYASATQSILETLIASGRDPSGSLRYSPTNNLAFPAISFLAIGGMDRSWGIAGGEDRDLCARWLEAGFRLWYESSAEVFHCHRLTMRGFLRQHFNYGRGAWRYHTRQGRFHRFESLQLYPSFLLAPFREHSVERAAALCGLVLLAQFSTSAGLIAEALRRGPSAARKADRSEDSAGVRANRAKRAS